MVAVKVGVGPTIMLRSGAWFDFCAPASSDFTIEDIAHGLANICRYAHRLGNVERTKFQNKGLNSFQNDQSGNNSGTA